MIHRPVPAGATAIAGSLTTMLVGDGGRCRLRSVYPPWAAKQLRMNQVRWPLEAPPARFTVGDAVPTHEYHLSPPPCRSLPNGASQRLEEALSVFIAARLNDHDHEASRDRNAAHTQPRRVCPIVIRGSESRKLTRLSAVADFFFVAAEARRRRLASPLRPGGGRIRAVLADRFMRQTLHACDAARNWSSICRAAGSDARRASTPVRSSGDSSSSRYALNSSSSISGCDLKVSFIALLDIGIFLCALSHG